MSFFKDKTFTLFILIFFTKTAMCTFLDLEGLLNPIINPRQNYQNSINSQNLDGFRRDKRGYNFIIKGNMKKNFRQNLQKQLDLDNDRSLYEQIGIQQQILYAKVLPIHFAAKRDLYRYFLYKKINKKALMESMANLRDLIKWILHTYLQQVNSIVIGNDNKLAGSHIFIKGNLNTVIGYNDFVFNGNFPAKALIGSNIVRIGSFDVDLDQIQKIKTHPDKAISFLGFD